MENDDSLKDVSDSELLSMYESEVQRSHYDPCDSMERCKFGKHELRKEILRRMQGDSDDE
jgi:hypothetical protein